MIVGRQGLGEFCQKEVHGDGGHRGQDEGEFGTGGGFDGGEDIGPVEATVAEARRSLSLRPPTMAGPPFLSDARFILEEQADAFAGMSLDGGLQGVGKPFF
jgi:hypothetical protein